MRNIELMRYILSRAIPPEEFSKYTPPENPPEQGPITVSDSGDGWQWIKCWRGNELKEFPLYTDNELEQRIEGYLQLARKKPELFEQSEHLPIELDRKKLLDFCQKSDKKCGLVYKNADNGKEYYSVIADVTGEDKTYARIIYPHAVNGTVIVPWCEYDGEVYFGIVNQYRHSIRAMAGGAFPRGFMEADTTDEENAVRELCEELKITPELIEAVEFLGNTRPDTGIISGKVSVYAAKLGSTAAKGNIGHEGIVSMEWIALDELKDKIRTGQITDGFTQSALLMYLIK